MAQVNITLNHEELVALLGGDREEAFKHLVEKILNEALLAESTAQLGAEKYERSDNRTDQRNGTRERELTTKIGTIVLEVPRHRLSPFHTTLFETYQRSETALLNTMAEMVIMGVSTRKVSNVIEMICGKEYSKSTISEVCKRLDPEIKEFQNHDLSVHDYPFIMVDATYFKVRENHRVVSKALFIAVGLTTDGKKEVLYFNVYDGETNDTWLDFFSHLKANGLKDPLMLTSDAHKSIRYAAFKVFPNTPWQRCQFHFTKNILDAAPNSQRPGLEIELRQMFLAKTLTAARKKRDDILSDYSDVAPKAMELLDNGFEDAMTVYMLPENTWRHLRTSNTIERLNRELKRRSDVIQIFPNEASLLRLMGSVLIDQNDILLMKRTSFGRKAYESISNETRIKLKTLAFEQQKIMAA
ncbi:IS256 family transposase [Butyrivibrio sp. FCS014]|uniref:IS256 family transposase n=1 Tax=Butyrivibrio sp. FCS014 TaxID=1408304 RepID=UPI0004642E9C|nr:IS256 family transposase [Butyrivibrio sp. FCS014]